MKRPASFDLEQTAFHEHRVCTKDQQDLFFPDDAAAQWSYARARRICQACPVRMECLEFALEHNERHGMWGGATPDERARIRGTRRRPAAGEPAGTLAPDPHAVRPPSMDDVLLADAARTGTPVFPVTRTNAIDITGAPQ